MIFLSVPPHFPTVPSGSSPCLAGGSGSTLPRLAGFALCFQQADRGRGMGLGNIEEAVTSFLTWMLDGLIMFDTSHLFFNGEVGK